jgi:hypothetical protein
MKTLLFIAIAIGTVMTAGLGGLAYLVGAYVAYLVANQLLGRHPVMKWAVVIGLVFGGVVMMNGGDIMEAMLEPLGILLLVFAPIFILKSLRR